MVRILLENAALTSKDAGRRQAVCSELDAVKMPWL
jgi:hypothetical protein